MITHKKGNRIINNKHSTKTFVISLGGSLISTENGIETQFLLEFNQLIRQKVKENLRFILVCGGGRLSRVYRNSAMQLNEQITDKELDWLGIQATRMNGRLVHLTLKDIAYPKFIVNHTSLEPSILTYPVAVTAGWETGYSSDNVAVQMAQYCGVKTIINLSNTDRIYTDDPKQNPDAKPLNKISWQEMHKLMGDEWKPGLNVPFDPVATRAAMKSNLTVIYAQGRDLQNLNKILTEQNFIGTTIH